MSNVMKYLVKGIIVLVLGIPAAIVISIGSLFGTVGMLVGFVAGLIVNGYVFSKYYKK